jgi:hypothetical protein
MEKIFRKVNGIMVPVTPAELAGIVEKGLWQPKFKIDRFECEDAYRRGGSPFNSSEWEGNTLLNEGIQAIWNIIGGLTAATLFNAANAYIGVGDSNTAAAASQTALQASTNKLYKAMYSGYPQRSNQTLTFRSEFLGGEANFAWNEFTVANGNSDSATNLNRAVSAQGTKTSGQVWTLDVQVTLS